MKIPLCFLTLTVAVAAVTHGTGDTLEVNWTELGKEAEEMQMLTKELLEYIIQEANETNPEIGNELEELVAKEMPEAVTILSETVKDITDRTLTRDKAEAYMTRLKEFLHKLRDESHEIMVKLPPENAVNIGKKIEETVEKLKEVGKSIHGHFHPKPIIFSRRLN